MILHGFYNPISIGNVALIRLGNGITDKYERIDDITVLYDCQNSIIGYNVFNATNIFSSLNEGLITITPIFLNELNSLLKKYNFETVQYDFKCKFVVGEIIELELHPDSDHLHVCKVDLGSDITQIVCGASNVELNKKVVVATIGAVMPSGLIIQPSILRKVNSNGMLCSARELKIESETTTKGIILLDDSYQVGEAFI